MFQHTLKIAVIICFVTIFTNGLYNGYYTLTDIESLFEPDELDILSIGLNTLVALEHLHFTLKKNHGAVDENGVAINGFYSLVFYNTKSQELDDTNFVKLARTDLEHLGEMLIRLAEKYKRKSLVQKFEDFKQKAKTMKLSRGDRRYMPLQNILNKEHHKEKFSEWSW